VGKIKELAKAPPILSSFSITATFKLFLTNSKAKKNQQYQSL